MAVQIPHAIQCKGTFKRVLYVGTGLEWEMAFVICMRRSDEVEVAELLKKLFQRLFGLLLMLGYRCSGKLSSAFGKCWR